MMKKLIIIISGILVCCSLFGQSSDSLRMAGRIAADKPVLSKPVSSKKIKDIRVKAEDTVMMDDTLTNEFLDTLNIRRKTKINDYSLIGVHYGVGLSRVMFNPTQKQDMVFMPYNVGVTYTVICRISDSRSVSTTARKDISLNTTRKGTIPTRSKERRRLSSI